MKSIIKEILFLSIFIIVIYFICKLVNLNVSIEFFLGYLIGVVLYKIFKLYISREKRK